MRVIEFVFEREREFDASASLRASKPSTTRACESIAEYSGPTILVKGFRRLTKRNQYLLNRKWSWMCVTYIEKESEEHHEIG